MLIKNCVFKIFSRLLDYQCLHYATFPPGVSVCTPRRPSRGQIGHQQIRTEFRKIGTF